MCRMSDDYDPAKAVGPDGRSYQQYLDERKLLLESERLAADNFDKMLLALSAGSIALSVTFVEKIGAAGVAKPLLYVAWMILAAGLIINLRSFMVLQASINRVIEINDTMFEIGPVEMSNPHQRKIRQLNRWAFRLFVGGAILLLLFAAVNFQASKPAAPEKVFVVMSDKDNMSRGPIITVKKTSGGPSVVKLPPQPQPKPNTSSSGSTQSTSKK